jgi:hypothetical protein
MTGGVLDRLLTAGEAGALGSLTISPSGFLITMAALLRVRVKTGEATTAGFDCGVCVCATEGAIEGVCGWPRLEFGLSEI